MSDTMNNYPTLSNAAVRSPEERAADYIVSKTDISPNQARELVERHGCHRGTLETAAAKLKSGD